MLDFPRPHAYADFGASLGRSYMQAAMRTFLAAASQGMLVWSGFIAASIPKQPSADGGPVAIAAATRDWQMPAAPLLFGFIAPGAYGFPFLAGTGENARSAGVAEARAEVTVAGAAMPAYRSDSGHAVAQIIFA